MKEDQHRDQKSKLTVDRLLKQVENLSQEAGALKLEKERMSEEMRQNEDGSTCEYHEDAG